jgi:hypothetical protein
MNSATWQIIGGYVEKPEHTSNEGLMSGDCHVIVCHATQEHGIKRILYPGFLSRMASYDVAITVHQS